MKNLDREYLERLRNRSGQYCDYGSNVREGFTQGYVCGLFQKQLDSWYGLYPTVILGVEGNKIALTTDDRAMTMKFLELFAPPQGQSWTKQVNDYAKDKIDYFWCEGNTDCPDFQVVVTTPPPPSCVVEEYEEEVPAQKVKRKRIVCPKGEEAETPIPPEALPPSSPEDLNKEPVDGEVV